jgi:DNA-binding LacI/PurR family transcriptional regulator
MAAQRIRRVALLIETTRSYTRDLLAGVRRWQAEHGSWSTFLELRAPESPPPPWLRGWDGDGILCRTFTRELAGLVTATGLPAVELRSSHLNRQLPMIGMDNQRIGRLVAEHFLERGYRHFATYRLSSERFFAERMQSFTATALGTAMRARWQASSSRTPSWSLAAKTATGFGRRFSHAIRRPCWCSQSSAWSDASSGDSLQAKPAAAMAAVKLCMRSAKNRSLLRR